jgi:hypothetical protein
MAFCNTEANTALPNTWIFIYGERGKPRKTSVRSYGSKTELKNKQHYTKTHYFMGVLFLLVVKGPTAHAVVVKGPRTAALWLLVQPYDDYYYFLSFS